jgi:hypothetical protein
MDINTVFGESREYYQSKGISRIYYCYLDSSNATVIGDKYQWLIGVNKTDSNIMLSEFPSNIRAIRLGRTTWSNIPSELVNYLNSGDRLVYDIDEFSSQSMLPGHFIQSKPVSDAQLSPITTTSFFQNRGWFRFGQLFTTVESITLSISKLNRQNIILPDIPISIVGRQYIGYVYTNLVEPAETNNGLVITDYKTLPLIKKMLLLSGDSFAAYTVDSYEITHNKSFSEDIPQTITSQLFQVNNEVFTTPYPFLQTYINTPTIYENGTAIPTDGTYYFDVLIRFLVKPRFVTTLEIHCDEF